MTTSLLHMEERSYNGGRVRRYRVRENPHGPESRTVDAALRAYDRRGNWECIGQGVWRRLGSDE